MEAEDVFLIVPTQSISLSKNKQEDNQLTMKVLDASKSKIFTYLITSIRILNDLA